MGAPNLFDYAKRLGIEPKQEETQSSSYALDYINEGIAGYKQYLADSEQERALVAEADKIANKPKWWQFKKLEEQGYNWWDGIADSFSSGYEKDENGNYKFTGLEKYQNAATANKLRHERPNNTWSQQELAEFGHKYVSNRDDAYAYAKQINDKYAREGREKEASETLSEYAEKHPVIASSGSIGLKIAGGLSDLTRNTMQYLSGGEIYEKDKVGLSDYGNAIQRTITENLNEKGTINEGVPVFGGKGWGDVYGLGMSIAQTTALAPTGSVGTLIAYFGTSASEAMSDALARGASSDQAYAFGLVCGAAEAIPEMIQMDKILGLASGEAVKNVFKSVLKQAGSEAGEELTTSIINEIADRWIMSDKSNFQMRVNSLIAQGYSPELAKKKAWAETFEGFAYDAITGAVSGGIMGAGAIGIGNVTGRLNTDANTKAKETLSPKTAELIEEGKKYESTKKRAEALEKKAAEGKELTGYELRMYSNQLSEAARTADVETTRKAIIDKMKAEGIEEGKAKRLGEIALNKAIGNEISQVQEVMLRRNEGAMKVYNQISEKVMDSGYGDSQWAEETAIRRLRAENNALNEARQAEANGTTVQQLQEQKAKQQRLEALKRDVAKKYGTKNYKISTESLDKVLGENNGRIVYKTSKDSMLDVSELKTNLSAKDIIELGNIEAIANALGQKIKVYATTEQKDGERSYVDKSGEKITANGFFRTSTGEIGVDLRAGMNGEGVMLYTTSHELVHDIKRVSEETFDALEKLVTKALVSGGYSIESLIEDQKNKLISEGVNPNSMSAEEFEALAREEMVADACMSFLASKNAIAEIKALQTENKGLWNALKKFFSKLFIRLNDRYKEVDPYSVEGLALADMRDNVVKPIRDIFFEGAKKIAEHNKTETKTETTVESNTVSTESIKDNYSLEEKAISKGKIAIDMKQSARDSLGNTLTPEQQEYFKESKVRDENGNLLVVYHGSPSEFTVFNKSKIGTHGSAHGHGFYFTENEGLASSYHKQGGQLLKGYLNITNPVSEDKLTIKKTDLVKLIKAICEQEAKNLVADDEYSSVTEALRDTFISNYVNTYEMSLAEAYRTVADIIYPTCDNDTDVLGELFNSGARGLALEKTREVLGCDGVIYTNVDGVHEYVAFESNQFKNITNKAPTKSADIRYSTRNYSEGLSAEDKAVADKVIKNLKQQKMASEYGVRNYATYTDNRMNYEIQYSSAQGDPDYAHAYITWVNPTDFVYATTSMESVRERLKEEAGKLDIDRLREQKQAIYLRVDFETGQIVGHEGRHRMLALQDAGIDRVAVIIEAKNDEYWHTKPIDIMHLKGQRFEERRTGTDFYIHDLLPLSERYAGVASEIFAHDSKNGIRFSSRDNIDKNAIKDYNNFAWVRKNNIMPSSAYTNFTSEFSKAIRSNAYNNRISSLGEYMIEAGETSGEREGVKNYIVFAKGKIESPEITRIVEIDGDNETYLGKYREEVYDSEQKGIRTKTKGIFQVYYATDYGYKLSGIGSSNEENGHSIQLGTDRGTGSGTAQRVKEKIPENLGHYQVVQKFKDANGKSRNIRRLGKKYMVEGTKKRNYLYDTAQEAIDAENAYLQSKKIKLSSRDTTYLSAVKRGDMETAQRMVDEVAKANGYNIKGMHATNAEFTEFDISKTSDINYHGRGIYFTNSLKDVENNYENYEAPDPWQKIEAEAYELLYDKYGYDYEDTLTSDSEIIDKLNECYDEVIDKFKNTLRRVTAYLKFDNPLVIDKHGKIDDYDMSQYDGIIDKHVYETIGHAGMDENTIHYIVFNPKNIKSAEAVTYDDNGNVIPLSERFNPENKDIRYSSRTRYSAGQMAAVKANLSHSKVYTKSSAMQLVKELAPKIRNRSFEALSDELWRGLNTYTTIDDRQAFATDMAEMFIDRMMVDTLVKHRDWDEAVEKMAYIKHGINSIKFRSEDIPDLEHRLDKKGAASLRGRWGYKTSTKNGIQRRPYGLDEFITDLSREMPGMSYLADMHPVDAMIEVDRLYSDLKDAIKDKYESAYEDMPEEFTTEMKSVIASEIMRAYAEFGEQTKISKYLAEKMEFYNERVNYWKAEHAKVKSISRWNGILATKALHIRDLKKGAFFNATQHRQDIFKESIEKLAGIQWRGNISPKSIRNIFADLRLWYTKENPMLYKEGEQDNLYSDTIAAYIDKIADTNKGAFDVDTYAMVYDVMNHLYVMMRNYNKIFRNGRWEDAPDLAKGYLNILNQNAQKRDALRRVQDMYNKSFLEPMAIARRVDNYNENGFFTQTMEELRRASINASVGEMNLRKSYDEFIDNNKKYLMNAAKDTVTYRGKEIPKLHIIGLYMTMKREHARAGLALNGFEFTMKNKWWDSEDRVYIPGYVTDADNATKEIIDAATFEQMKTIEGLLTDTDMQYIKVLETLFNEDLKNLKVERDMERQGYTNATLDYYYPIMRGAIAENIDTAKISDQNRATNASFNKNTVKGSKQRLVIISADAMVNRHISDMCKYYYMSQAIENYNVIYNCDISDNPNNPRNIATVVQDTKVWEKDFEYFRNVIKDMQGIRDPMTAMEKAISSLRGNYAKFALSLNAKVIATQFSSMIAAGDILSFASLTSPRLLKISSRDVEKYCPLAAVRSYDNTALKAMSLTDKVGKVSEILSIGISKTDSLVIHRLFAACQLEAEKQGAGSVGTEENKIAAGKLLEQVIIETQQNSYATERSAAMRSKNELLKSLTMFTADGIKVISRIYDATGELKVAKKNGDKVAIKKARKKLARSYAAAVCIAAYLTGIAWVFTWLYDKDDEEEDENKILTFALDTFGNFISALPGISDLYDYIANGFETESVAFDTYNNVISSIGNIHKDLSSIVSGDGKRTIEDVNRDLRSLLYGVGQASGIPFRNAYNLVRGVVGNFSSKSGYKIDSKFYKTSLSGDLEDAIKAGDESKSSYIMSLIYDDRVGANVSEKQRLEIIRLTKKEYSVLPKTLPDEVKRNGKKYVLTESQKVTFTEEYSKVVEALDKLISSGFYTGRSDKDRAHLIDYYHDKYYDMAVNKALGLKDENKPIYNAIGFSTYAKLNYVTKDIESDKDKNGETISGSKKKKVIEAVKKATSSEEKALLYIASKGYSLTDAEKKKLCKYLNSLNLSASSKKILAEKCGFSYKNGKITP